VGPLRRVKLALNEGDRRIMDLLLLVGFILVLLLALVVARLSSLGRFLDRP
jgi:hypothetical protein